MRLFRPSQRELQIKLSDVMSALSYALDLVEGQPEGHSVRSCIIGMRLGKDLGLSLDQLSSLFYALLMKDLGCSSNAAKMCFLFDADDRSTKCDFKTIDWRDLRKTVGFALEHVAPGKPWFTKMLRMAGFAMAGRRAGKELIKTRCERGANIARLFGLGEDTAIAIHCLDEHFDGGGHPEGFIGDQIPLLARIMCISQTIEVFLTKHGRVAMREMLQSRRGTWFDPQLVDLALAVGDEDALWNHLSNQPESYLWNYEPEDRELFADDDRLDNIAAGFAQVIDAKSPWTFRHSKGVADVAVGIARVIGLSNQRVVDIRRAALLHDIGKLGVSNLILDKPGKLDATELAEMRRHPQYTHNIIQRVAGFSDLADMSAAHHERLDGKGYFRGWDASQLSTEARILCVSDMYEALAAKRPYREDMSPETVMNILNKNAPNGICPEIVSALKVFLNQSGFVPYQVAA